MKITLGILIISFLAGIATVTEAQQWQESYDPNTEIAIKGKIVEIMQKERGQIIIGVLKQNMIYNVFTAPRWYIEEEKIDFKLGDEVVVHGAKFFSKEGTIFIIARSIHNISTGKIYQFRDEFMKPCWRGKGYRRFSPQ